MGSSAGPCSSCHPSLSNIVAHHGFKQGLVFGKLPRAVEQGSDRVSGGAAHSRECVAIRASEFQSLAHRCASARIEHPTVLARADQLRNTAHARADHRDAVCSSFDDYGGQGIVVDRRNDAHVEFAKKCRLFYKSEKTDPGIGVLAPRMSDVAGRPDTADQQYSVQGRSPCAICSIGTWPGTNWTQQSFARRQNCQTVMAMMRPQSTPM